MTRCMEGRGGVHECGKLGKARLMLEEAPSAKDAWDVVDSGGKRQWMMGARERYRAGDAGRRLQGSSCRGDAHSPFTEAKGVRSLRGSREGADAGHIIIS